MNLDEVAIYIAKERLQIRAGCAFGSWWVRLERDGETVMRGSGITLEAALCDAAEGYFKEKRRLS